MQGRKGDQTWVPRRTDVRLSLLIFVVPLMSGVCPFFHGNTTDTLDVDVDALSIFTGTLETGTVCPRWSGSLLFRERLANPSFGGWLVLGRFRSGIAKLDETPRLRAPVG